MHGCEKCCFQPLGVSSCDAFVILGDIWFTLFTHDSWDDAVDIKLLPLTPAQPSSVCAACCGHSARGLSQMLQHTLSPAILKRGREAPLTEHTVTPKHLGLGRLWSAVLM